MSKRLRATVVGVAIAGGALFLLVERGPGLWARMTNATDESASAVADRWKSLSDSVATAGSAARDEGRRAAESTASAARDAIARAKDAVQSSARGLKQRARDLAAEQSGEEPLPPPPDVAAAPAPAEPSEPVASAAPPVHVGVNSDPWSNVSVDDVDYGSTPLSIALPPGPHRFRATMADGRVIEKQITVAEGRNQVVFH